MSTNFLSKSSLSLAISSYFLLNLYSLDFYLYCYNCYWMFPDSPALLNCFPNSNGSCNLIYSNFLAWLFKILSASNRSNGARLSVYFIITLPCLTDFKMTADIDDDFIKYFADYRTCSLAFSSSFNFISIIGDSCLELVSLFSWFFD